MEKVAIRHKDNPVLRDKPSLAAMGGWSEAEVILDMKKMKQTKMAAISMSEKSSQRTKTEHKGK